MHFSEVLRTVQPLACMSAASERHKHAIDHADLQHTAHPMLTLLLRPCYHRPHRYSNHAESDSDGEEVQSRREPARGAAGEAAAGPAAASWPAAAGTRTPRLRLHSRMAAAAVPSASEQVGAMDPVPGPVPGLHATGKCRVACCSASSGCKALAQHR